MVGKFLHKSLALCLKLRHAKFQRFCARRAFLNSGLNGGGIRQMCIFQRKTGHVLEAVRDTAKVAIIH